MEFADLSRAYTKTHITTNTTTVILPNLSGSIAIPPIGILGGIFIGNPGSAWLIQVYDCVSGAQAAANLISAFTAAANNPWNLPPLRLTAGLSIVTSGTTPGDMTVAAV
jgi:hypothetical protein